jgi:hypothetical protein
MRLYPGWHQGRAVHLVHQPVLLRGVHRRGLQAQPLRGPAQPRRRNSNDGIDNGASATGTAITSNSGSHLMLAARTAGEWIEADASLVCDLSLALIRAARAVV